MMKKTIVIIIALLCLLLTSCGKTKSNTPQTFNKDSSSDESVSMNSESEADYTSLSDLDNSSENSAESEMLSIDMGDFVNSLHNNRPVVEIRGDEGIICSVDISQTDTNKIEITLEHPVERGSLYIMMSGNVTKHSLHSDGSLFDGLVYIEDNKAEFTVEYDGERAIEFVINVPSN